MAATVVNYLKEEDDGQLGRMGQNGFAGWKQIWAAWGF
jgi:hypothetical protein